MIARFPVAFARPFAPAFSRTSRPAFSFAVVLLAFLPAAVSGAERLRPAAPEQAGMSRQTLREAVQPFRQAVENDELRGAILLVARNGQVVLHEALGWRDFENRDPLPRDAILRMGSNTKAVVAAGVLQLQEHGHLSVDDRLGEHLPEFDNEHWRDVRIRHLLSHTSGCRIPGLFLKPLTGKSAEHPDGATLRHEVSRFADVPPKAEPGTTYSYNNAGYNILGAVIEEKSGQLLHDYLHEHVYEPLRMVDTSHAPDLSQRDRLCFVYERKDEAWKIRFLPDSPRRVPFTRGSGGMFSTARDFARFCQSFLDGGALHGRRILSTSSVAAATRPQNESAFPDETPPEKRTLYGYGWRLHTDGTYAHSGSEGTYAWVDPQRNLVGILFTQSPGGKLMRQDFRKAVTRACVD